MHARGKRVMHEGGHHRERRGKCDSLGVLVLNGLKVSQLRLHSL